MLHTGFDATPESKELACIRAGHAEYVAIHEQPQPAAARDRRAARGLERGRAARLPAHRRAGAAATALTDVASRSMPTSCAPRAAILPLTPSARVVIPGEHIIVSLVGAAGLRAAGASPMAARSGATPRSRAAISPAGAGGWRRTASAVEARVVINAAGNYGDLVEAIARPSPFADQRRARASSSSSTSRPRASSAHRSCRCRASAPRASWSAARSSATCWSDRRPRTRRTALTPASMRTELAALDREGPSHPARPRRRNGDRGLCRPAPGDAVQGLSDRGPARTATGSPSAASARPGSPAPSASPPASRRTLRPELRQARRQPLADL